MEKEERNGLSSLSGNGMVTVALLAMGALFLREHPMQTSRPAVNEPRAEVRYAEQDIDARLWQDPFGAIARARDDAVKKLGRDAALAEERQHTERGLAEVVAGKAAKSRVNVLAVMLAGGPYSESIESRRRTRYAVLAGLSASRYVPVDTEHLGYFFPAGNDTALHPLPETVPYEWFDPAPDANGQMRDDSRVLVLWLDNSAFYHQPLARLRTFATRLTRGAPTVHWQLLGPMGSDALKAMIDEAKDFPSRAFFGPTHFRIYSPGATVPDAVLLGTGQRAANDNTPDLARFFTEHGIQFVRTIGNDQRVADGLMDELALRGLQPSKLAESQTADAHEQTCRQREHVKGSPSHIAVIAEWDTMYGRSLRRHFKATKESRGFCVEYFNYVRGVDGILPERATEATPGAAPAAADEGKSDKPDKARRDGSLIERAEGQGQFDYLRRLAGQIRARDEQLRRSHLPGAGILAIAVLGNDVHDKLLVLQALQPEFPGAIFFTTDLDARLLHPREKAWTRNLIVGSSFGLRLEEGLQAGAPSFRDGYQTANFFSTRLAMEEARDAVVPIEQSRIDRWLGKARIFEIGRTMAFDFSPPTEDEPAVRKTLCRASRLLDCPDIHPEPSPRYPRLEMPMLALVGSMGLFALWAPLLLFSRNGRRRVRQFVARGGTAAGRVARRLAFAAVVVVLQLVIPLAVASHWERFADWLTASGKPLIFTEGISIWPTETIRVLTLLLCVYFVFGGWSALARNLDTISLKLRMGKTRRQLIAERKKEDAGLRLWQKVVNMFCFRFVGPHAFEVVPTATGMTAYRAIFWKRYIVQNRAAARLVRAGACVVLMSVFGVIVSSALGEHYSMPQRGPLSRSVHDAVILPMGLLMQFLVFYVADASVLCVRFVQELRLRQAAWPPRTVSWFQQQLRLPGDCLNSWIDLQFVARRTHCVGSLIYYPFIVLSLALLSRSPIFDDWQMPRAILVVTGASVAIVFACALALRRTAETSRRHALREVDDWLMHASGAPSPADPEPHGKSDPPPVATVAQLKLLRGRIESLRDGAFAPFSQQPLLRAVVLPFATVGGTSLLDYMTLANF